MTTDADISPDPPSRHPAGAVVTEAVTVTETVTYDARCPSCRTGFHNFTARADALAAALSCCGASK